MASNNNNDRPNNLPYTTSSRRGPPKAQLSLQKILLNPISSTPPPYQFRQVHNASATASSSSSTSLSVLSVPEYDSVPMGYNLDLNLPPPPETHEDSPSSPLHGSEKVQECNLKSPEGDNGTSMLQDGSFVNEMEINNLERERVAEAEAEIKKGSEREENKTEIRFGALLDAVECAMEEEYGGKASEPSKGEEEKNELNGRKRQRMKWKTEKEEVEVVVTAIAAEEVSTSSPVVKSNRGRNQVLPCKYRDSVIEPLTHLSSRHSRSSSTFGPTRRRSK